MVGIVLHQMRLGVTYSPFDTILRIRQPVPLDTACVDQVDRAML